MARSLARLSGYNGLWVLLLAIVLHPHCGHVQEERRGHPSAPPLSHGSVKGDGPQPGGRGFSPTVPLPSPPDIPAGPAASEGFSPPIPGSPSPGALQNTGEAPRHGLASFGPGESLVYEVSYFGVVAGVGKLEVLGRILYKGRDAYRIRAVAESSKLFSYFYRVYDVIEIILDAEGLYPLAMTVHIEQGKEKYDELYEYDHERGLAIYVSGDKRKETRIPKGAQDSLSSLYYYRSLTQGMGETIVFDVYASQKVWSMETTVLKRERVKTRGGEFSTIQVRPVTRFEGVLQRRGDLLMWFTDDERRIPVRLQVEVVFGSVYADLIAYTPGALPQVHGRAFP